MKKNHFFEQLDIAPSFVGARAQRLTNLIGEQADDFLRVAGITIPSRCISTLLYLQEAGPSSLSEVARALVEQHQLTAHRLAQLEKWGVPNRLAPPPTQDGSVPGLFNFLRMAQALARWRLRAS